MAVKKGNEWYKQKGLWTNLFPWACWREMHWWRRAGRQRVVRWSGYELRPRAGGHRSTERRRWPSPCHCCLVSCVHRWVHQGRGLNPELQARLRRGSEIMNNRTRILKHWLAITISQCAGYGNIQMDVILTLSFEAPPPLPEKKGGGERKENSILRHTCYQITDNCQCIFHWKIQ